MHSAARCWFAPRSMTRAAALPVLVIAFLAACASTSSDQPSTDTTTATLTANQQDAVFAAQLIELSEQLVTITDILEAKTDSPATSKKLEELSRTANERVSLAKNWLILWGRTNVDAPPAPGLLTEAQMDALIESNGAELNAAAATAMTRQLEGTLEISKAESSGGQNSTATSVAEQLAKTSQAELQVLGQIDTGE